MSVTWKYKHSVDAVGRRWSGLLKSSQPKEKTEWTSADMHAVVLCHTATNKKLEKCRQGRSTC